jgi:hypothetical protein
MAGFNPEYDDKKNEDTIYFGKVKENEINGTNYRSAEIILNNDVAYLSDNNVCKDDDAEKVKLNVIDNIELFKTDKGQQKISCWLIEDKTGQKSFRALYLSRRTKKGAYSSQEITLNNVAVGKLFAYLKTIHLVDVPENPTKIPLNQTKDGDILTDEEFEKIISTPKFKALAEKMINKSLSISDISNYLNEDVEQISNVVKELNTNSSDSLLKSLKIKYLDTKYIRKCLNENHDEKFWQDLFQKNPELLFAIIPSAMQLIESQPYVGGKRIDNENGLISDFIFNAGTSNVSMIEIKKPNTELLSTETYRNNLYSPSKELSGGIVQLRKQKDQFTKKYDGILIESMKKNKYFKSYDPKMYLIIGNTNDFDEYKNESFELFRNELKDIEIITYNELLNKLELIISTLNSK